MCLSCLEGASKCISNKSIIGKERLKYSFEFSLEKTFLHTFDNKIIHLNKEQIEEIIENAVAMLSTGVDLSLDIWAIQWPNNYKVKTF